MLTLQHTHFFFATYPQIKLTDIPSEVLDTILNFIYHDSGGWLGSVLPVSRTCRCLRASSYPIILAEVTIKTDQEVIRKSSWDFLQYLGSHPILLQHIRTVNLRWFDKDSRPDSPYMDCSSAHVGQLLSKQKLLECLSRMSGLRTLRVSHVSGLVIDVLTRLSTLPALEVALDLSHQQSDLDDERIEQLKRVLPSTVGWTYGVLLSPKYRVNPNTAVADLFHDKNLISVNWSNIWSATSIAAKQDRPPLYLEELRLSQVTSPHNMQYYMPTPGVIPYHFLRRLHVQGDIQVKAILPIINTLTNMEDLCLLADSTNAFHPQCLVTRRHNPVSPLPFTTLSKLRHLTLSNVCPHYHFKHLTTPTLQSLSVTMAEMNCITCGFTEARHTSEIRWLAANLPHLECLELHVGPLENLWHPTAIPGVEVNVEVYAVFQAITLIRKLHTLRLFPPYIPRDDRNEYLTPRQPLSDEQAIRIFHHLHSQRPSLHSLSIGATFNKLRGFKPMTWLVRDARYGRAILTTRQAQKDYELVQTWVGQRRMSMQNRRNELREVALRNMGGDRDWMFPPDDPAA